MSTTMMTAEAVANKGHVANGHEPEHDLAVRACRKVAVVGAPPARVFVVGADGVVVVTPASVGEKP